MKLRLAAPLAVGLLTAAASAQGTVLVGDTPDFTLTKAHNTMGAVSAEDFRGKPVLVDFWGTK